MRISFRNLPVETAATVAHVGIAKLWTLQVLLRDNGFGHFKDSARLCLQYGASLGPS